MTSIPSLNVTPSTSFDAVTSDIVEIVVGDVMVRAGSDVQAERLAAIVRAVRQA
jgi:transposase